MNYFKIDDAMNAMFKIQKGIPANELKIEDYHPKHVFGAYYDKGGACPVFITKLKGTRNTSKGKAWDCETMIYKWGWDAKVERPFPSYVTIHVYEPQVELVWRKDDIQRIAHGLKPTWDFEFYPEQVGDNSET